MSKIYKPSDSQPSQHSVTPCPLCSFLCMHAINTHNGSRDTNKSGWFISAAVSTVASRYSSQRRLRNPRGGGVDDLRDEGRLIMSRVPSVRVSCVCVCVKQGRPGKPTIGRCFKSSRQEQYGELGHLAANNERIHTSFMNHEQYREENLQARFFSLQKGDVIVCYQSW